MTQGLSICVVDQVNVMDWGPYFHDMVCYKRLIRVKLDYRNFFGIGIMIRLDYMRRMGHYTKWVMNWDFEICELQMYNSCIIWTIFLCIKRVKKYWWNQMGYLLMLFCLVSNWSGIVSMSDKDVFHSCAHLMDAQVSVVSGWSEQRSQWCFG